jgi:ribonucleotide reductase beta subunit family protein with ferritin-like domain
MKSNIFKNTNTLIFTTTMAYYFNSLLALSSGFAVFMSFTKYQTLTNSFQYIVLKII